MTDFHPSSYGYRPGRSCHQAVAKAEMFINKYGLSYVVDMDLSKCFDRLNHELILEGVNRKVSDGSILKLKSFKEKIRKMPPRNHGMNVEEMVKRLNPVLRGWANYFRIANCQKTFRAL